jgi:hypothetical protein
LWTWTLRNLVVYPINSITFRLVIIGLVVHIHQKYYNPVVL